MECVRVQELLSDYSVGLVTAGLQADIDAHLDACPECRAEMDKLNRVMGLVENLEISTPPAGLWNGVYNRLTEIPERPSLWNRVWSRSILKPAGWSVGVATAALVVIMFFTQIHDPVTERSYASNEYVQSHAVFASQDMLADQVALHTVAAIADREQLGGSSL